MENNASTNVGTEVVSQEDSQETSFPDVHPNRKIKWPFVAGGILVILLGVLTAGLLVNRSRSAANTQNSEVQNELVEYKNPNGFALEYPRSLQLVPTEEGIRLTGETEVAFMVKPMEKPLEVTVNEIADNFGINEDASDFSTQTINSRTGFVLNYQDKEYLYFPLFGEYYLEVVLEEGNQIASEVLNTLEFTPPQATLN